jgi:hypothetical protein
MTLELQKKIRHKADQAIVKEERRSLGIRQASSETGSTSESNKDT